MDLKAREDDRNIELGEYDFSLKESGQINAAAAFRDKRMEKLYFCKTIRHELNFIKWIVLLSGFSNLLFLIHDYYYIPNHKMFLATLCIRVFYALWTFFFFYLIRKGKHFNLLNYLVRFTEVYFIYTQIQIFYLLKFDNFDSHSLPILIIFIGYAIVSNYWLIYTVSVIVYTVFYFWTTSLYLTGYSIKDYISAGIYFTLAIMLCSLASYRNNLYKRTMFYERVLKEEISKMESERSDLLEREKQQAMDLLEKEQIISKVNKMAFLRSQIRPHFIYNALNTIEMLCYDEPTKAGELILHFSSYLNYAFNFDVSQQFVPFEYEMNLIYAYVEIEKARFSDRFEMKYDLCDTQELILPPLIIQPLIENAIKHGVGRKGRKDTITLRISKEKQFFIIQVEDNGIGIKEEKLASVQLFEKKNSDGVGLSNINERLKELYHENLTVETTADQGTRISFCIPQHREEQYEL